MCFQVLLVVISIQLRLCSAWKENHPVGLDPQEFGGLPFSEYKGVPSWVELPEDQWPEWWKEKYPNMERPVVRLLRTLYGHPDAPGYWERDCEEHIFKCSLFNKEFHINGKKCL